MLQRAFYLLRDHLDFDALQALTEQPMIERLLSAAGDGPAHELLDGLFGPQRRLYKRLAQYSYFEEPEIYQRLARQPYATLARPRRATRRRARADLLRSHRRAARDSRRRPAGRARSRVRHRGLFPQAKRLPPTGRRLAGRAHARPRAVRRLREARAALRPPASRELDCEAKRLRAMFGERWAGRRIRCAEPDSASRQRLAATLDHHRDHFRLAERRRLGRLGRKLQARRNDPLDDDVAAFHRGAIGGPALRRPAAWLRIRSRTSTSAS